MKGNISGVEKLAEVGVLLNEIGNMCENFEKPHIEMCIETPQSSRGFRRGGGAFSLKTVQAARNQWESAVKKRWPRKNTIIRVTPGEWRKAMTKNHSIISNDPKEAAIALTGIQDHNEAEAMLILEYWLGIRANNV